MLGDEARQRNGVIDFGNLREPLGECRRVGERRRQHVDRVRRRLRILHQVEQRRDRLDRGAAQVQRIEVELQPWQQRKAPERDHTRRGEDPTPPFHQKSIERRQRGIRDGGALARRTQ